MAKLIELIPNFSEGRNCKVIDCISNAIVKYKGAKIIHRDMGYDANRTVITFVAPQEVVVNAAFDAVKTASEQIDMRLHKGEHPRIGATDVMPFVPLGDSTMEETIDISRTVAKRITDELGIKVYCYEKSAFYEHKQNLYECRKGEYEGIQNKLTDKKWQPDFNGGDKYDTITQKSGITVIGARNFLLAVNFNLATSNIELAKEIAKRVRYSGYIKDGVRFRGSLEGVKAIGWYLEEYGFAQVSMNIVDIDKTSLHEAYNTLCKVAKELGTDVTGTEIIGMLPKRVMVDAGQFFATSDNNMNEIELIKLAAKKMNFDQISPFECEKRIIELMI